MKASEIIKKKEDKKLLTYEEIKFVVNEFIEEKISRKDMTSFIKAVYEKGLTRDETFYLTDVMIKSGTTLDLSNVNKVTVDKHSTGGIGDKTSLILLPICASLGVGIPKMSGRSLGITGGTVDKLESIPGFKSDLPFKKFIDIVNKVGCADICQNNNIALADKKIYALRDETGYVNSIPLIASSIMSKKVACGCDNIVIDLKVGDGAFMENVKKAKQLAKLMIYIGKKYNKNVRCILTNMDSPLGYNIGNILEVKEAINFFDGKSNLELEELIIKLSSHMISMAKNTSLMDAKREVNIVLKNGLAKSKFYEWISSQGGKIDEMKLNAHRIQVRSTTEGYVNGVNAKILGTLTTNLGAGRINNNKIDPNVGIVLKKKIGDYVEKNEVLAVIYYTKEVDGMVTKVLNSYLIEEDLKKSKNIILKVIK